MLTLDLLRYKVDDGTVTPIYLTITGGRRYVDAAARIVAIYGEHVGKTVGELEAALDGSHGSAPDYKVYRGLAKVMSDYAVIGSATDLNAEDIRLKVFAAAAEEGILARRSDLLFRRTASEKKAEIAADMGLTPDQLDAALYADLRENQIVREADASITAERLIQRYNTALAQAMLYRATRMIADVYDSYRVVFRHIKLARLMHTIRPHEGGYRIEIDGPMSLFANVERYGVAMARFLPAILKCKKWRLAAKVTVGDGGEKLFRLSPKAGLVSHYSDIPQFDSAPEEAFSARFARNSKNKWLIEREGSVLDLKDSVLIPDFKFVHKDGTVVHLEIVGYWTPQYLERKLEKLSLVKDANVLVATPESMACSDDAFAGHVIRYKTRLLVKQVLPALEAFRPTKPSDVV